MTYVQNKGRHYKEEINKFNYSKIVLTVLSMCDKNYCIIMTI